MYVTMKEEKLTAAAECILLHVHEEDKNSGSWQKVP